MIDDTEELNRLLFSEQMVGDDGILKAEAFPMDELLEKDDKSASLDRSALLADRDTLLRQKLNELSNPESRRAAWGIGRSVASEVRTIALQDGRQAFEIFEDKLDNDPPKPWDEAHAKLVRSNSEYTRGLIRGCRDKLIDCFSQSIERHVP